LAPLYSEAHLSEDSLIFNGNADELVDLVPNEMDFSLSLCEIV